jgi:hypothetical protein
VDKRPLDSYIFIVGGSMKKLLWVISVGVFFAGLIYAAAKAL